MAGRSNTGKVAVITGYLNDVATFSLHTADPGTTGINEVTGGSPAYARKARPSFTVNGTGGTTMSVVFDVPAGANIQFAGMWDGSGNFLEGGPVSPTGSYASQGTYSLTVNGQGA